MAKTILNGKGNADDNLQDDATADIFSDSNLAASNIGISLQLQHWLVHVVGLERTHLPTSHIESDWSHI